VPKKIYRTVTREASSCSTVREYLPPKRYSQPAPNCDDCNTGGGVVATGARGRGLFARLHHRAAQCDPCSGKIAIGCDEGATCTSSDAVCEVPGVWVERPVVCRRTITCQIPCTVMEKQVCRKIVPVKIVTMVKEECVKHVPICETRMEQRECVKRIPYCVTRMEQHVERRCVPTTVCRIEQQECVKQVCEKVCRMVEQECVKRVPVTVCKTVAVEVCEKVPYTVCKKVPYTACQKVPVCVKKMVPYTYTENVCKTIYKKVPYTVCVNVPEIHCPPLCVDGADCNCGK
jgi:hypothetical protein